MVEIIIDGQRADLEAGYTLPKSIFSFDGDTLRRASHQQSGRSVEVRLPSTPRNDRIMLHALDPVAGERFNAEAHEARVVVDGGELMRGQAHLMAIEGEGRGATYILRLRDGAGHWAERAAMTELAQTGLEYDVELSGELVEQSWGAGAAVRFLPVRHDDYTASHDSTSLFPPQRVMTMSDYHPFISVRELLRRIFADAGYEVESDFMASEMFGKLHISGCYATAGRSLSKLNSVAGFLAGRESEATATADSMGRVWLTPLVLTSSLGNIVESVDNDKVVTISDEGVTYRPSVAVTAGFEIRLKYRTDFKIISGVGVQGFNALYVDSGCDVRFNLANPYPDRRNTAKAGVEYRCVIFDYAQGDIYRLVYTSDEGNGILSTFAAGTAYVTVPEGRTNVRCTLQHKIDSENFVDMSEGWCLYDGYVADEGEMEVDVTIRTPPEVITPSGKSFVRMYLHGAAEGQRITLLKGTTLRPIFSATPTLGSRLTLSDVLQHGVSQMVFIEAVQQIFNLRIATDHAARKVYIEPHDDFYNGALHDWSERVDVSGKILAEELSASLAARRTLCYRAEADGAVARYNEQNETTFGEWTTEVDSRAVKVGRERNANTLFSPTLSAAGIHALAPSAVVMQVGDRDSDELESVTARIVSYEGLRELPAGEVWSFPSYAQSYPFAAFHSPGEFTLCFEDRDGVKGLHRYYDGEWQAEGQRRALSVDVRLAPHEVAGLVAYGGEPSVRSRYALNIGGQRAVYNLMQVESYDAERGVARCRFVRRNED
ncbi:MAG: hypothetical protein IKV12_01850 [Alistipes sp.]|nr:hypothetical protein [Alistipes sp.]